MDILQSQRSIMAREILTAQQHIDKIVKHQRKSAKEKRDHERYLEKLRSWDDLKGDATAVYKNGGWTPERIREGGGPQTAKTISGYINGTTKIPHLPTFLSWLRVMGKELYIGDIRV